MIWQVAAVLNIIFGTIRVFLDKKLIEKVNPLILLFYTAFWSGVFYLLFFLLRHESLPLIYPGMMVLGGVYAVAVIGYLWAIRVSLSQTMVFAPYSFIITLILAACFLGEWKFFDPSTSSGLKTIAGIFLAIISLWLIVGSGTKREKRVESRWIYAIVLYIILIGIGNYFGKAFLLTHGPLETLISQQIGAVPFIFLFNIFQKVKFSISLKNHLLLLTDGLVMAFAITFFYLSLALGPVSLVLPIQTLLLTMTTVLLGFYVFKEAGKFSKEKLLGMGLGIVGVILLVL